MNLQSNFSKLALLLLFLLPALAVSAQPGKGSLLIGGTVGFNALQQGDYNTTNFNLSPFACYFLGERVALGGGMHLSASVGDGPDIHTAGLEPLVRYYFNGAGAARIFGQAELAFRSIRHENRDPDYGSGLGIGFGADFFLNERVAIELLLGFDAFKYNKARDAIGTTGLNVGIAAFIGGD